MAAVAGGMIIYFRKKNGFEVL